MTAVCHIFVFLVLNSCREARVRLPRERRTVADGRGFAAVGREGTQTMLSASAARRERRRCMAERKQKEAPNEVNSAEEAVVVILAMAEAGRPAWMISTWSWRRRMMIA